MAISTKHVCSTTATDGSQTKVLDAYLRDRHGLIPHPKGNTAKVLRYTHPLGHEVAVEKRKDVPIIYVAASAAGGSPTTIGAQAVSAGPTGRNSNLNTLDSFRRQPLWRLPAESVTHVDALMAQLR